MSGYIFGLFWNNGYENFDFTYTNKQQDKQNTLNTINLSTLTEEDKKNMYAVELNNIQINDINDIFCNLFFESLTLNKCKIQSLKNLKNNKTCKKITIIDSHITDFDSLKDMNIEYIKIQSSNIDISFMIKLEKLKELHFRHNKINEICDLSGLLNLRVLNLSNNNIKNITNITNLENLNILIISNNEIESLAPLSRLRNLEYIYADNNKLKNIIGIENLKKIKYLNLSNNEIQNIDDIIYFNKLEILKIKNTDIVNLPNIMELKNLDYNNLEIDWNKINKINNMKGFPLIKNIIVSLKNI
jgi:internalin A